MCYTKSYGSCCHPHHHHSRYYAAGCCCPEEGSWRRYVSKAEKTKRLMRYREELEAELSAVNELLEEIKKNG